MTTTAKEFFAYLQSHGIASETEWHSPAFTVEDARRLTGHIRGGHTKNLLLECKRGSLWLIVCLDNQKLKINGLSRLLKIPRLSFASAAKMKDRLGVEPGSVSPFALINDSERIVQPVFDAKMLQFDLLNYHPLTNSATTTIRSDDLRRFVEALGYRAIETDLDATQDA
ncbi:MAG: prolyl-tRNA synthetase associated domain-containing protein [Pseudomonadota bacterium]